MSVSQFHPIENNKY